MTEDEIDGSEQTQLDLAVDEADASPTDSDASNVDPEDPLSVEELIEALERVTAERDDHRDSCNACKRNSKISAGDVPVR